MKNSVMIIGILLICLFFIGGFLFFQMNNQNSVNSGSYGNPNSQNAQVTNPSTQTGTQTSNVTNPVTRTPQTYNIAIQNMMFQSAQLTIHVGDTVIWTNKDSVGHTVTSDSGSELSSSTIGGASSGGYYSAPSSGGTYSHTFTAAGTYNYHCSIHPSMTGTITVQ